MSDPWPGGEAHIDTGALMDQLSADKKRIAELEAERDDLRQRLIGGVNAAIGNKTDSRLHNWATANEAYLSKLKI